MSIMKNICTKTFKNSSKFCNMSHFVWKNLKNLTEFWKVMEHNLSIGQIDL